MRRHDDEPSPWGSLAENPTALGTAAAGLIAMAALAACSLGAVPPLHYGIRYNVFNKYADIDNVYVAGRYFIGPWNSFLLFPSNVKSVEFSNEARLVQLGIRYPALHTRTKEGLALHMQVSLQYRLIRDQVGALYKEFSNNYENFFISQIRDTLIKVAADYEGPQLWEKRKEVGERMQRTVSETLQQTYAECWGLQLMVVELPQTFDRSIVNTQIVKQNISTMEYAQTAAKIRAETKVIQADFARKVKVIKAEGRANYTLEVKKAKAAARSRTLTTEALVLDDVKARLALNPEDLVEYQEYSALTVLPNASVFFGFEEGAGVILQQSSGVPEGGVAARSLGEHFDLEGREQRGGDAGATAGTAHGPPAPAARRLWEEEL